MSHRDLKALAWTRAEDKLWDQGIDLYNLSPEEQTEEFYEALDKLIEEGIDNERD